MILEWIGFIFLIVIGLALSIFGVLNLLGSGDRTGPEHRLGNIIQCIFGIVVFIGAFFVK